MKVRTRLENLTVIEFRTEKEVMDLFYENFYNINQEIPLKLLVYNDHAEMHTAIVCESSNTRSGTLYIKKHVRKFYYPDMIAMNETIKKIERGEYK